MKTKLLYFLVLLIFIRGIITAQTTTHIGDNFELDNDNSGSDKAYIARDYIKLKHGFTFNTSDGHKFDAKIDNNLIFDTNYSMASDTSNTFTDNRTLNVDLAVGTIKGELKTTDYGTASYTIPIITPPGTNSMIPSLSLIYNSTPQNGVMGVGWNLSGLSSIKRTNSTIFSDGAVKPVTMTMSDKFSLDGNRLVVTNGTYGADGSVYHTEMETFSKITTYGTNGNGPDWFLVETKDGKKMYYGNTDDSKVIISGTTGVYSWLLSRIEDNHGNYIDYTYVSNEA